MTADMDEGFEVSDLVNLDQFPATLFCLGALFALVFNFRLDQAEVRMVSAGQQPAPGAFSAGIPIQNGCVA